MKESQEIREELSVVRLYLTNLVSKIDYLISECGHKWNKEEIELSGWKFDGIYAAGDEYFYTKNNKQVRVSKTYDCISTYDGFPHRQIMDEKELEDYANS